MEQGKGKTGWNNQNDQKLETEGGWEREGRLKGKRETSTGTHPWGDQGT